MSDQPDFNLNTLEAIQAYSRDFANRRGWQVYQTPKNLSMALSVECSELLEHFQWLTAEESLKLDNDSKQAVSEEIADVLFYLLRIADQLDVDVFQACSRKAQMNEKKYPLESTLSKRKNIVSD